MKMFIVILLPLFMLFACGKDSGSGAQPMSAEDYCERGWSQYENGEFDESLDSFEAAITEDSDMAEGYVGKGWASLRLDLTTDARLALTTADQKSTDTDLRINIGLAALYNMVNSGLIAVGWLSSHVSGTDTWVHNHDPEIDAVDIHNLLAEAYILCEVMGTEEASAVNELNAWGQVKKSLALDPADAKALELQAFLQGGVEL